MTPRAVFDTRKELRHTFHDLIAGMLVLGLFLAGFPYFRLATIRIPGVLARIAWCYVAAALLARAAGLHCSRVDGSPLVYNEDYNPLPDLIVCRPELADQIIDFVKRHGTG